MRIVPYAESWNNAGRVAWPAGWSPAANNLRTHFRRVAGPPAPVWDDRFVFGQPHR